MTRILKTDNKKDNKFLRKKTSSFDFDSYDKDEIRKLIDDMKQVMKDADGVGLAANQIGIDKSFFVVDFDGKFYTIFNPEIVKKSRERYLIDEGCLSIPDVYGNANRSSEVTLKGYDRNGKRVKMRVWGYLAQIFQHEVDHLNGILFTDYLKE